MCKHSRRRAHESTWGFQVIARGRITFQAGHLPPRCTARGWSLHGGRRLGRLGTIITKRSSTIRLYSTDTLCRICLLHLDNTFQIVRIIGLSEMIRGGVQAEPLRCTKELWTGSIRIGGIPGDSRIVEGGFEFGGLEG